MIIQTNENNTIKKYYHVVVTRERLANADETRCRCVNAISTDDKKKKHVCKILYADY